MEETGAAEPLSLLLEVQDHDLELDRLAYRRRELPERRQLAEIAARREGLHGRRRPLQAERAELTRRQEAIEGRVEALVSRVAAIDSRLQSEAAGSFRDQQAMGNERASLDTQRVAAEDEELEMMELLEPLNAELSNLEAEMEVLADESTVVSTALEAAETDIDAEIAGVASERDRLASGLPADLAATYERLRTKLGGVGAAKLVAGACSGCHLTLPSRERDQVLHAPAGTIFYCEQCGRILVP